MPIDIFKSASESSADSRPKERGLLLLLIILIGCALRALCFIGYGLGDDDIYAPSSLYLLKNGALSLDYGPNYRYGVHIPVALAFMLSGINQFSFVAFTFLCSLGQIIVIFKITDFLCDRKTALVAATLASVCSFDIAFASTMTIDIQCTFLMSLSFYLFMIWFRQAEAHRRRLILAGSIFLVVWSYFIKFPALILFIPHVLYSLLN